MLIRPEQAAPAPVEPEAFEQEDVGRGERVHASASQRPRRPGRPIFARNALNRLDFAGFRTVSEDFIPDSLHLPHRRTSYPAASPVVVGAVGLRYG